MATINMLPEDESQVNELFKSIDENNASYILILGWIDTIRRI